MSIAEVLAVLDELLGSLMKEPDSWENPTLDRYLEAMRAWLNDSKDRIGERPSWSLLSDMLEAEKTTDSN